MHDISGDNPFPAQVTDGIKSLTGIKQQYMGTVFYDHLHKVQKSNKVLEVFTRLIRFKSYFYSDIET